MSENNDITLYLSIWCYEKWTNKYNAIKMAEKVLYSPLLADVSSVPAWMKKNCTCWHTICVYK